MENNQNLIYKEYEEISIVVNFIILVWIFILTFVLIPLLIILNGSVFQYTDWTILLLFIPPFVSWTASCYYDELYRRQFVEMIKDDVQKCINPKIVDKMSKNEIFFIYNKYIKK